MLEFSETITVHGVSVPFVPDIITPKIERPLRNGRYEKGEVQLIRNILRPGDRLLELGAGLGVVSTAAAQISGVEAVLSIEADPGLIDLIRETWRLNSAENCEIRNAVASGRPGTAIEFFVREDFWASSMEPDSRPYKSVKKVPVADIAQVIEEFRPTVLSCDIEGGELGLLDRADLSGLRHIVMETHPKVYGQEGLRKIVDQLGEHGFLPAPDARLDSSVKQFDRIETEGQVLPGTSMPRRRFRAPGSDSARILVPTCMKNEGPFILEWLAWHRAIGVTDFVVFTNDCTDGSERLLERLDQLGYVKHMPNPALATGRPHFQPDALQYVVHLPSFREADYVISMDVDEFINVRTGEGRLQDLLEAAGDFDVLSISELNHGCGGRHRFEPGFVCEQYPGHQTEMPGNKRAQRGVKSIVRLSPRIQKVRNHRPDVLNGLGSAVWLDGSGRPRGELSADPGENGWDCRGSYDLVSLDHFPLRSLQCYLVKMHRGDVVVANKGVSQRYWRTRNHSENFSSDLGTGLARMRAEFDRLLTDPETRTLHEACIAAHQARISDLSSNPEYTERMRWIYQNSWRGEYPAEAEAFLHPDEEAAS